MHNATATCNNTPHWPGRCWRASRQLSKRRAYACILPLVSPPSRPAAPRARRRGNARRRYRQWRGQEGTDRASRSRSGGTLRHLGWRRPSSRVRCGGAGACWPALVAAIGARECPRAPRPVQEPGFSNAPVSSGRPCDLKKAAAAAYIIDYRRCPGAELNHRHTDFQSVALPTELPGHAPAALIEKPRRPVQSGRRDRTGSPRGPGNHPTLPSAARRSTMPGKAPVCVAFSTTRTPLTRTVVRAPLGYWCGFS